MVLYTQNDLSPGEWFTPVFLQSVTSAPLHFTITVNQSSNVFKNLKAANGYLIPQFVSVSGPASSCDICAQIARQSKSSNGEALSLELCHELLGALEELGRYRSAFLTDANFVNLFPTAYYDVTALEMQRIAAGTYKYPIEKMQQMLAFFDAYKSNRDAWNLGATPEPHWAAYYAAAHNANEVLSILVAMSRLPDLSPFSTVALDLQAALSAEKVLMAGIHAHVDYDLPRALRYSFGIEFDTVASSKDLLIDFVGSNGTLDQATPIIARDMFAATGSVALLPQMVTFINSVVPADINKIIMDRLQAWNNASNGTLPVGSDGNSLGPQPLTDHAALASAGALGCDSVIVIDP